MTPAYHAAFIQGYEMYHASLGIPEVGPKQDGWLSAERLAEIFYEINLPDHLTLLDRINTPRDV